MRNKITSISPSIIRRLPIYLRLVQELKEQSILTVSSQEMGDHLDLNPAQIRKDLASFGEFGRKGVGYDISYLDWKLRQLLNLDRHIGVALIGAGHLGIALSNYARFQLERITIAAVFDRDPQKIGMQIGTLTVADFNDLTVICQKQDLQMGIIAVPASSAQEVCDALVSAGIRTILNFAPVNLRIGPNVHLRNTDVTTELQALAYYLDQK
ncbi:MAG: redox-sensing transcriptional repressor Rex [Acidibacillus sp.]|uniref:Redox-sensing transcriptional repressor Rex n=1 Tax=Sulfoacidibacillus ferrooxidans TaxID=2005001 RepID=A0A9X2AE77_9BACL|nr:redox-sensing transcriptional repressor Rex [Sulfoacidibacillus ferrooxidans]MCI0184270.1 Redox-sensing transcriptional repressor Rex [Sulfoacidibacillus ferrooxidans]MCY0894528.1 redox-sensing transcriptional repressor Rex [Acidibacillus sp.]